MFAALIACALTLCTALASALPADSDYTVLAGRESPQTCTLDSMLSQLNNADVVFVGENHDHKQGHALELTLLTEMHRQNPAVVLSLEMFERDVQPVLDEYLQDLITESSFLQAARPWPNYKDDYRPLVEFCKANHLPVVAANAPRRYVNIVSRKGPDGLKSLSRPAKTFLAPLPYSLDMPSAYSRQLDEIFNAPHGDAPKASAPAPSSASASTMPAATMPTPANLKAAQALWDATMADSISRAVRRHPHCRIVQMNGCMHSDSGYGIADRLHHLIPSLKIAIVSIKPDAGYPNITASKYAGLGDFVIVTR